MKKWKQYQPDYKKLFPGIIKTNENLDLIDDLLVLDMKPILEDIISKNKDGQYGYIPLMMSCSSGQLGALNAESFAERINSAAKILVTNRRTRLSDEMIDMLVMLRMNRDFMKWVRENKNIKKTVITGIENLQEIVPSSDMFASI